MFDYYIEAYNISELYKFRFMGYNVTGRIGFHKIKISVGFQVSDR